IGGMSGNLEIVVSARWKVEGQGGRKRSLFSFMNLTTNFMPEDEAYDTIFGPYENDSMLFCCAQLLHPKSRGTVRLQSSDPYDPPLIDPNYFDDPSDIDNVVAGE
ncbi:hypothetical protein AVEN_244581-1, partial [Araneus ventricosus]